MNAEDYVWWPEPAEIARAHVTRLMGKAGFPIDPQDREQVRRQARTFISWTQREMEAFWTLALADMDLVWTRPYQRLLALDRGPAWAEWFVGGETNIVTNCIDRHARGARHGKVALIAETEDGQVRRYTYVELDAEVCRVANALQALGVGIGDRVACYMPMVAEVVIAMLASQKIGAVFIPIFSGYAAPAVRERLVDAGVKLVFTSDGSYRRGRAMPLKATLDEALTGAPNVEHTLVHRRVGNGVDCPMQPGRDQCWEALVSRQPATCETRAMPARATALMLYTSGTTGKPKGTVHTHAGCLAQMGKELLYHFDLRDEDVFWWFTDIGWMMGPWEIIGCLMHGGTLVVFEGAPDYPEPDRIWQTAGRHGVTTLGVSPTAIRMLMRAGDAWIDRHPLTALRMLGSTGEPWDPESYRWYFERVGRGRCPIINISGGTDIVGCFLAPLPILPLKPTSLQSAGLGMDVAVFDEGGRELPAGEVGYLVCRKPAPSMTRSLWNNDEAYLSTYWSKFPNVWNHGDWARIDADGDWFHLGRADDTMKIAGRRVGPGEIESALIEHPAVSEAAAVGVPDALKGTELVCFVVLHPSYALTEPAATDALRAELVESVVQALGRVDRPKAVYFVEDLPKTRSAKILRRLVLRVHLGETALGDLSSVANPEALQAIARAR